MIMIGRTKENISLSEQNPPFTNISINDITGGLSYSHIYNKKCVTQVKKETLN